MGLDCAFLTYLGKPLATIEVARLAHEALRKGAGADVVFLVHAINQKRDKSSEFNCICLFEGVGENSKSGLALQFSEDELKPLRENHIQGGSLSDLVKAAFKLGRREMIEAAQAAPPPSEFEDEPLGKLAALVSQKAGAVLFAGVFDHSCIGSHARYENGNRVEGLDIEDDTYESAPDAALAQFLGVESASVQALYSELFEDANPETLQLVKSGELVSPEVSSLNRIRELRLDPALA